MSSKSKSDEQTLVKQVQAVIGDVASAAKIARLLRMHKFDINATVNSLLDTPASNTRERKRKRGKESADEIPENSPEASSHSQSQSSSTSQSASKSDSASASKSDSASAPVVERREKAVAGRKCEKCDDESLVERQVMDESNDNYLRHYIVCRHGCNGVFEWSVDDEAAANMPQCGCNAGAVMKRVKKYNANHDRPFFSCARWPNGCEFFKWADEEEPKLPSPERFEEDEDDWMCAGCDQELSVRYSRRGRQVPYCDSCGRDYPSRF